MHVFLQKTYDDAGRSDIEKVLMTDHRLMCDVAGKEFLYVETSAEATQTLETRDMEFLLMLIWGHLEICRQG